MPDIDNQLALDPANLQMFLRQIVKTDESIAVVADGPLLRLVDFGQEYCLTKWGLSYNRILDLGQNGCSTSHRLVYTESYSATQKNKYCFLNSSVELADTIVEDTYDQINDEVAVDAALEDL